MNKQDKLQLLKGYYQSKGLNLSWNEVEMLQNIARRAQTLAVKLCNGDIEQEAYDRAQERMWDKIKYVLCPIVSPTQVEIQGDPRGYCFKINLKSGEVLMPHQFN